MINIIAVNIKQGGGLILLKLLIKHLINDKLIATIHVDQNVDFTEFECNNTVRFKLYNNFLSKLLLFGQSKQNALYFGNIPPFFTRSKNSYLYFQNAFYTKSYRFLLKNRHYKIFLQKIYISLFVKNVNLVFVQTNCLLNSVKREFGVVPKLMPYYEDLSVFVDNNKAVEFDFSYISLPNPNKNLELFFESLILLNSKLTRNIKIVLTIPEENFTLIRKIQSFEGTNIIIINIGEVSKDKIIEVLNSTRTLVFPSLIETFGLPLVEASQLNTFVLCSDLPYANDVITPSATFNPYSKEDIANKMFKALDAKLDKPKIIIENKIEELIKTITQ